MVSLYNIYNPNPGVAFNVTQRKSWTFCSNNCLEPLSDLCLSTVTYLTGVVWFVTVKNVFYFFPICCWLKCALAQCVQIPMASVFCWFWWSAQGLLILLPTCDTFYNKVLLILYWRVDLLYYCLPVAHFGKKCRLPDIGRLLRCHLDVIIYHLKFDDGGKVYQPDTVGRLADQNKDSDPLSNWYTGLLEHEL